MIKFFLCLQEHRITKLPHYSHKKMNSDVGLSNHTTASWDRNSAASYNNKTWNESTSLASFRSRGSETDNNSTHSAPSDSPKDNNR